MNKLKKGFTLTEVIISIVILGFLALVIIPNIKNMMPDDRSIKYKKAFYTIQEIVNDLVNDPSVCQGKIYDSATGEWSTPRNEANYLLRCYNPDDNYSNRDLGVEICKRLNRLEGQQCIKGQTTDVKTTDGLRWYLPEFDMGKGDFNTVNNRLIEPFLYVSVNENSPSEGNRNKKDGILAINVYADGKVLPLTAYCRDSEDCTDWNTYEKSLLDQK